MRARDADIPATSPPSRWSRRSPCSPASTRGTRPSFDDPPVPAIRMSDGPAGVRGTSWTGPASASFPCGAALGATWDPALVEQVGRALGREARSKSAHVLLAPDRQPPPHADRRPQLRVLQRGPGADGRASPWPTSAGVQHERVAACVKHFVGNDTEFERMTISSEIDERTLRELYLVPFEAAVRRGRRALDHDGATTGSTARSAASTRGCSADVLRGEWGFDGAVDQRLVRHPQRGRRRCAPGSTSRCPARRASGAAPARRRRGAATSRERDLDRARRAAPRARPSGPAPAATGTAEVTADDPETRAVIRRRRGAGDGAAEERRRRAAAAGDRPPGRADRAVRPVRPAAGRRQRAGAADHGRGPLDALQRRAGSTSRSSPAARSPSTCRSCAATSQLEFSRRPRATSATRRRTGCRGSGTSRRPRASTPRGSPRTSAARSCPTPRGTGSSACAPSARSRSRVDGDAGRRRSPSRSAAAPSSAWAARRSAARSSWRRAGATELDVDYPVSPATSWSAASSSAPAPCRAGDHIARAAAVAAGADVAIVIVGTDDDWETEGEDRTSLALPGDQDDARRRRRRRQPEHGRRAQHRVAGDDAVARRRARPCCSCGSPARSSATRSPTC